MWSKILIGCIFLQNLHGTVQDRVNRVSIDIRRLYPDIESLTSLQLMSLPSYSFSESSSKDMDELKDILERVFREEEKDSGLVITNMNQTETNPGDNFLSEAFTVNLVGRTGSGTHYARRVFVKKMSENKKRRELSNMEDAFKNETFMYTKLLPLIPGIDEYIPKCLFANNKYVVMADLQVDGYRMLDKKKGLDLAQAELVMKATAAIHAGTCNMRVTKGEEEVNNLMADRFDFIFNDKSFISIIEAAIVSGVKNLKIADDETLDPVIQKLEGMLKLEETRSVLQRMHQSTKLTLICHGDIWINNILFRFDENGVADTVKIVDFQLVNQCSLAIDILRFLYTSILPELLNDKYDYLISVYSSNFIECLRALDIPKCSIPTEEELKKEIDSREWYGFLIGLFFLPGITREWTESSADFDVLLENLDSFTTNLFTVNARLSERIVKLAKRCIARGLV